jgi:general secretion pathway protein G
MTTHKQKGFTLIEILVSATIIAVLTAIGLVSFSIANRNARDAKRKADLEQVRAALEIYRSDNTSYPASANFDTMIGVIASYTTSANVADPKGTAPYVYRYTQAGSGASYTLCATLENTGTDYCLNSP